MICVGFMLIFGFLGYCMPHCQIIYFHLFDFVKCSVVQKTQACKRTP